MISLTTPQLRIVLNALSDYRVKRFRGLVNGYETEDELLDSSMEHLSRVYETMCDAEDKIGEKV